MLPLALFVFLKYDDEDNEYRQVESLQYDDDDDDDDDIEDDNDDDDEDDDHDDGDDDDDDNYCVVESHANEARDSGRSVGDDN